MKRIIIPILILLTAIIGLMIYEKTPKISEPTADLRPKTICLSKGSHVTAPIGELVTVTEPVTEPAVIQEPELTPRLGAVLVADLKAAEQDPVQGEEMVPFSEQETETETEPIQEQEGDRIYLGTWTITAYCGCSDCCGSWSGSPTASGAWPAEGWTVAADLPFGTMLEIEGVGVRCVEDRGVYGEWIDVYFDDHQMADDFGMQELEVWMIG